MNADSARAERIRRVVRLALDRGLLRKGTKTGAMTIIARYFQVSRARIHQIVDEERKARA